MNIYCKGILNQMDMAVDSVFNLMNTLSEEDLSIRPTAEKMSIGELLAHMSILCKADFLIGKGVSEEEIDLFYEQAEPAQNLKAIADSLRNHYQFLKEGVAELEEVELLRETTAFWGGTHSRYEWLVDTQAHFYHHRGQLHAMLVHVLKREPNVQLFE